MNKENNATEGIEKIPALHQGMSFITQKGIISWTEQVKEEQKKHSERQGEQIKELVDRLGEYEQEIYGKDLELQLLKNEIFYLEQELCEKEQYIEKLETNIGSLTRQNSKEAEQNDNS